MSAATLHTLDNGVRLLLDPMPGLATSSVGVWVKAGTRAETLAENGIAHLLEHLVFKGAGGRDARALVEEAEGRGIYLNAATGYERTGFFARCLAEDASFALELASDLVLKPHLNEADLALEKGVILQEIGEAFDDAEDRCGVLHQMAAFPDQALGRPILGDEASLAAITKPHIDAFRARTYAPSSMMIAAAGSIDTYAIIDQINAAFGDLPNFEAPCPSPAQVGGQLQGEVRDSEQLHLTMSLPGPKAGGDEAMAARIMCEILGGGMASRLFQDLRETRGLVYSVEAFCDLYEDTGRICISAGCSAGSAHDVASRSAQHLIDLAENGPSERELKRAVRILEASMMMAAESPAARCEGAISQTLLYGRPLDLSEVSARIRGVTMARVREAAQCAVVAGQLGGAAASAVGPQKGLDSAGSFGAVFAGTFR
jgi:predicted Zn-dependent peptidase